MSSVEVCRSLARSLLSPLLSLGTLHGNAEGKSNLTMKRGFLLRSQKQNRNAVSLRDANRSPPSPDNAMLAHAVFIQHAAALAFLTREPAVLWLCRGQQSKEAVLHFKQIWFESLKDDWFESFCFTMLKNADPDWLMWQES